MAWIPYFFANLKIFKQIFCDNPKLHEQTEIWQLVCGSRQKSLDTKSYTCKANKVHKKTDNKKKGGNKFQVSGYQKESAEKQTIMQVVRGSKQTFALMPFPSFQ